MKNALFSQKDFQRATTLDDAVMEKFARYHALLLEWNPRINLVAASTLPEIWQRHFMDAAQLAPFIKHAPLGSTLIDLGSGAGFPGMVLAMMGFKGITLAERDARKIAFLRTVAGETKTDVEILHKDAATLEGRTFDIITARALAEVEALLNLSQKLRKPSTYCLFLKGKNLDAELLKAQKEWVMQVHKTPSVTDAQAFVLRLAEISGPKPKSPL